MPSGSNQLEFIQIRRYPALDLIGDLEPPRVWIGTTSDGRFWACKQVDQYQLFSECLGYLLAKDFDVRTPDFAVHRASRDYWMTELINPTSHCDASRADEISNYPSIGRLLVLDLLIGAFDRHELNILIDWGKKVCAWAIDFEKSFISKPGTFDVNQRFNPPQAYLNLPAEIYIAHAWQFVSQARQAVEQNGLKILTECENLAQLGICPTDIERDLVARAQILPELLRDFEAQLP